MRFLKCLFPAIVAIIILSPGPAWSQEDRSLECSGTEATMTMEIARRDNYDAETHPYSGYINIDDCTADEEWEIDYTISGEFDDSDNVIIFRGNGCVNESDTPFTEDADCERLEEILQNVEDSGLGNFTFNVSQLLDSCDGTGSAEIWFVLFPNDDQTNYRAYCSRSFKYDMEATAPPTVTSTSGSDGGARLAWEHATNDDPDHDGYIIYCASVDGEGGEDGTSDCPAAAELPEGSDYSSLSSFECATIDDGTTTSTRVGGLENGQQYAVAIATIDVADNIGVSSPPYCVTPQPVDDFFSYYLDSGGEAGFCFVATAAYDGDYDHPDVMQLRWFRDTILRRSPGGTWLIGQYYRHGRDLANRLESHPRALAFVRSVLEVATDGVRLGRAGGMWWTLLLVLLVLGTCFRWRGVGA